MDILTPVETYDFYTGIKKISNDKTHLYIGGVWKPDREIFIIGATIGLLCLATNRGELYLSISRTDNLKPGGFFQCLKKDSLFYLQRDQRFVPQGPGDLMHTEWCPSGTGFFVGKDEPLYFRIGAVNKSGRAFAYDVFATLYWIEIFDTMYRPSPLEKPEDFIPPEPK